MGGACVFVIKPFLGLAKVLLIVFFFMSVYAMVAMYNMRRIIMDNWDEYKCNPLVTPFSELFGRSSVETRNQCVEFSYMSNSQFMINPLTNVFSKISLGFGDILAITNDVNFMTVGVKKEFSAGYLNLLRYLQNVASTMQYLVYKIQTMMQRMVAVIYVLLNVTQELLTGMESATSDPTMDRLANKSQVPNVFDPTE
jgi:hypothetical protein